MEHHKELFHQSIRHMYRKTLAIDPRAVLKADVQMRYIEPNVQTKWGGGYVKMMNQWGDERWP